MNLNDCYRVLGLSPEESIDEVYQAYRELSMQYHPHKHKSSPRRYAAACKKYEAIHQAYYYIGLMATQTIEDNIKIRDLGGALHANSFRENAINLRELGKFRASLEMFAMAIRCDPSNDVTYVEMALLFTKIQQPMLAIDAIVCALRINPDNYLARFILGSQYMFMGLTNRFCLREKDAMAAFEKARQWHERNIEIYGPDEHVYDALGRVYEELGRFDEASRAFNEAIRLFEMTAATDPNNAERYHELGDAYLTASRYSDAVFAFQNAVQHEPSNVIHWWFLGFALSLSGEFRKAVQAFKEGIRVEPTHAHSHLDLGRAQLKLNNKLAALEEYKILQTLSPEKADKLFNEIYP